MKSEKDLRETIKAVSYLPDYVSVEFNNDTSSFDVFHNVFAVLYTSYGVDDCVMRCADAADGGLYTPDSGTFEGFYNEKDFVAIKNELLSKWINCEDLFSVIEA